MSINRNSKIEKNMKTNLLILSVFAFASILFSTNANAQCQGGQKNSMEGKTCLMEELSPEQKTKVEAIKMESEKKIVQLKADMKIKKAELNKLMIADPMVQKDINAKIDEVSVIKANIEKEKVAKVIAIRSELTPEQKVKFDAHRAQMCEGKGMGKMNKMSEGSSCHGQKGDSDDNDDRDDSKKCDHGNSEKSGNSEGMHNCSKNK
jgi:Spy/CpxP family protein refolding chaperone